MWIVKTRPNRPACFHNPPGVFAARPEPLIGLCSARFFVRRYNYTVRTRICIFLARARPRRCAMSRATSAMRTVAIGAERLGGARLGARHQSLMRPQPGTPGIEACAANAGACLPSASCSSPLNMAPCYRLQETLYITRELICSINTRFTSEMRVL